MKHLKSLSLTIILSLPIIVLAQSNVTNISKGFSDLGGLVDTFNGSVVKALATLCLTAGVTAFFFGIVQYIWGRRTGDAAKLAVGNSFMVWGLIALFVMFSVWGIVRYAQRLFGIEGNVNIIIPQVEFGSKSSSQTNTSSSPNNGGGGLPAGGGSFGNSSGSGGGYQSQSQSQSGRGPSGIDTVNSGLGVGRVTQATQQNATGAYQSCMKSGGTGADCQKVYENALKGLIGGAGISEEAAGKIYTDCIKQDGTGRDCLKIYNDAIKGVTGKSDDNSSEEEGNSGSSEVQECTAEDRANGAKCLSLSGDNNRVSPIIVPCGIGQTSDGAGGCITTSVVDYVCPDWIPYCSGRGAQEEVTPNIQECTAEDRANGAKCIE